VPKNDHGPIRLRDASCASTTRRRSAVKNVVVIRAADSGFGRIAFAGIARRAQQARSGAVDAEIVVGRKVNQIFGINGAVQMIVQVTTLGDVVQEGQQERWLIPDRVEIARSLLLAVWATARAERNNRIVYRRMLCALTSRLLREFWIVKSRCGIRQSDGLRPDKDT